MWCLIIADGTLSYTKIVLRWDQIAIIIKHHILKHHIPELPNMGF